MLCRWLGCLRNSVGGGMGCACACVSTPTAAAEKLLFNKERKSTTPMHVSWLTSNLYGYDWIYVKSVQRNLPEKTRSNTLYRTGGPSGIDLVHYLCNCYSSGVIKCSKSALFAVSSAIACLHLRPCAWHWTQTQSVGISNRSSLKCVFKYVFVLICVCVCVSVQFMLVADSYNLFNAHAE